MASIDTTRVWKGITVKESTDTSTGRMSLKSTSGSELAHSDSKSWTLDDSATFSRLYNNADLGTNVFSNNEISQTDFNQVFFNEGVPVFDGDRADILNNDDNFSSTQQANLNRTSFFDLGIPGVSDPQSRRTVNSDGNVTDLNPVGNPVSSPRNISSFTTRSIPINTSSAGVSGGGGGSMRYPVSQLPDLDYDFIQFEIYDYVNKGTLTAQNIEDRLGAKLGTITLPMVGSLGEQNSVDWGEDSLNRMQELLAGTAMDVMENPANIGNAVTDLTVGAQQMIKQNPGVERQVAAYFAGQALGVNLQARATGQVLNPNMELLFKGPRLRSFNFNFKFRPRFEEENIMIRQIIKAFKRAMAPQRSAVNLFLQTPNVFKVIYTHNGGDHPYMNYIKPCALTAFNVSYTPDNSYMTYPDGGLTGYDVQFTMSEILPIFQDDHDTVGGMGY